MGLYLLIAGEAANLGEEGLLPSLQLSYLGLMLLYLALDLGPLSHVVVVFLNGLLHGEDLTLLPLELLEKNAQGSLLQGLLKVRLLLAVLRGGKNWLEGWVVSVVVLQEFLLVRS